MHALWTPTSHQNVMEKFCEACLQGQTDVKGRCWERRVIKIAQLRSPPVSPAVALQCFWIVSVAICFSIIWVVCQKFQFPGHSPKRLTQCFCGSSAQPSLRISLLEGREPTVFDPQSPNPERMENFENCKFFLTHLGRTLGRTHKVP